MNSKTNYIIVAISSMVRPYNEKAYKSRKCAQNRCDKKNSHYEKPMYAVYSNEEYNEAIKGKGEWKTNLMSGQKVWVPAGTPMCCDVSSETYWSM